MLSSIKNRTLACGKKVYFKIEFESITYTAIHSLEYTKIMEVIRLFYPSASMTSGCFGVGECNITVATY